MVLFSCLCFPCWAARWRHFCFVSCSPPVNCMIVFNCLVIPSLFPPVSYPLLLVLLFFEFTCVLLSPPSGLIVF
uniref:Uncharacterized protein n=1 Tax=Anguilla anguilla TaxID=7936 RepID=A0A0E9XFR6_ANGAN